MATSETLENELLKSKIEVWRELFQLPEEVEFTEKHKNYITSYFTEIPLSFILKHERKFLKWEFRQRSLDVHADLRLRLKIMAQTNPIAYVLVKLIATTFLIKCKEYVNFIGISTTDSTKISYLNQNKIDQLNDADMDFWDSDFRFHASAGKVVKKVLDIAFQNNNSTFDLNALIRNLVVKFPSKYLHLLEDWYLYPTLLVAIKEDNSDIDDVQNYMIPETIDINEPTRESKIISYFFNTNMQIFVDFVETKYSRGSQQLSRLFSEKDYNDFTTAFRQLSMVENVNIEPIIVTGEDIRQYYLEDNYAPGSGELSKSCMRYSECQPYLDLYVENPSLVSMAVLLSGDNLVQARSLMWKYEGETYYDRIYACNDVKHDQLLSYFMRTNLKSIYYGSCNRPEIKYNKYDLERQGITARFNFDYYPYADSMCYLCDDYINLSNYERNGVRYQLNQTDGSYEDLQTATCDNCGHSSNDLNRIEDRNSNHYHEDLCNECCDWSEHNNEYIPCSESVYADDVNSYLYSHEVVEDITGTWISKENSVELYNGDYLESCNDDLIQLASGDYASFKHHDPIEYKGLYYLHDEVKEDKDGVLVPTELLVEHEGELWISDELDDYLESIIL